MTNDVVVASTLKLPARRLAAKAIESVHLAYYEKGGIRDTAATLTTQLESASVHVYAIAKFAAKAESSLEEAGSLFIEMCDYAETEYKREHDVENLREALPTWATYKSNVLRGLRAGLSPLDFKTEKVYRSKTMEKVSKARLTTIDTTPSDADDSPRMQTEEEVTELVASTGIPDVLQQLVASVVYAAEIVNSRKLAQAEEILREAWQKLGALTDKRKLK